MAHVLKNSKNVDVVQGMGFKPRTVGPIKRTFLILEPIRFNNCGSVVTKTIKVQQFGRLSPSHRFIH